MSGEGVADRMRVENDLQVALDRAVMELATIRMELGVEDGEDLLTVVKQIRDQAIQAKPNLGGTSIRDLSRCLDVLRRAYGIQITVTRHGTANTWNAAVAWQGETWNHAGLLDDNLLQGIMNTVSDMVAKHKDRVVESLNDLVRRKIVGPDAPPEPTLIHLPGGGEGG